MSARNSLLQLLPCGCKAVACDNNRFRIDDGWDIGCPKRHKPGDECERIYTLTQTVIERYYYNPAELAEKFGITTEEAVIDFFERHDGSLYIDTFFHNDANPQVGTDLVTGWDDD